jgi:hypothetical protein
MALERTTPRTRRAILAGALGAAAAVGINAVAGPGPAQAAVAYVQLGGDSTANTATTPTDILNSTADDDAFSATATGDGIGVAGFSGSRYGVFGNSGSDAGVKGASGAADKGAVTGQSSGGGTGVFGISGLGTPVALAKTGVYGLASQDGASVGVRGASTTGRGGVFKGKAAQLRLMPSTAATHPASGQLGDLFLDSNKRLWFCKGGTSWKQIA